jgi:hypothetical protein
MDRREFANGLTSVTVRSRPTVLLEIDLRFTDQPRVFLLIIRELERRGGKPDFRHNLKRLSHNLGLHPDELPKLYGNLVELGESGALDEVLNEIDKKLFKAPNN